MPWHFFTPSEAWRAKRVQHGIERKSRRRRHYACSAISFGPDNFYLQLGASLAEHKDRAPHDEYNVPVRLLQLQILGERIKLALAIQVLGAPKERVAKYDEAVLPLGAIHIVTLFRVDPAFVRVRRAWL